MHHLAAFKREKRRGQSGIIPGFAAVPYEDCQSRAEMLNGLLVHEQCKNAPGETLRRLDARGPLFEPTQTGLNCRRPFLIPQR